MGRNRYSNCRFEAWNGGLHSVSHCTGSSSRDYLATVRVQWRWQTHGKWDVYRTWNTFEILGKRNHC